MADEKSERTSGFAKKVRPQNRPNQAGAPKQRRCLMSMVCHHLLRWWHIWKMAQFPTDTSYFRAKAPPESFELRGGVIKLQRSDQQGPPSGPVTILTFLDGLPRKVQVTLAEADHQKAVEAYQRGATVTCSAELIKQGTQFVLQNPREFTVSQEE